MKETNFFEFVDAINQANKEDIKPEINSAKKYNKNMIIENIAIAIVLILFITYFLINKDFIKNSIEVHELIQKGNIKNSIVENYILDVSEIRVRKCSIGAKILFTSCSEIVSSWALGSLNDVVNKNINDYYFDELNTKLNKMRTFY